MMNESLTDQEFWRTYWRHHPDLVHEVSASILFADLFATIVKQHGVTTALDLGGFPGHYCVFLEKHLGVRTTLLDFVIDRDMLDDLRKVNGLGPERIAVIEQDLSAGGLERKYDLVYSLGLIEHFADTKRMIEIHASALNENGVLLIGIPNFRGINGVFQRIFDRENYAKHNIDCMDPKLLERLCRELGFRDVHAWYHMKFGVWLEDPESKSRVARMAERAVTFAGKAFFRVVPVTGKLGSPFLFVTARHRHED
jgi:SAM-dependent methyltransferase